MPKITTTFEAFSKFSDHDDAEADFARWFRNMKDDMKDDKDISYTPLPPKESAGVLLYDKDENDVVWVFLIKPGGPFFKGRDKSWGMPKGGLDKGETPLDAAVRELREETGITVDSPERLEYLGEVHESATNKKITAFAYDVQGNWQVEVSSDELTMKYNGEDVTFPEVEEGDWFQLEDTKQYMRPAQQAFIKMLEKHLEKEHSAGRK